MLDGKAVLGGNLALVEAELLAVPVAGVKEWEHSVKHRDHFVNLVRLVNGLIPTD